MCPRAPFTRHRRSLMAFPERRAEELVLIDRDEIDSRADRGAPAFTRGSLGSEVVAGRPASGLVARIVAVERVEPNPQSRLMRGVHEISKPRFVCGRPLPGGRLSARLDDGPRVVPPTVIVRAPAWTKVG